MVLGEKDLMKEIERQSSGEMVLEMKIIQKPGQPVQVAFPFLSDQLASYGFLKLAEKTLDKHYAGSKNSQIIKPA